MSMSNGVDMEMPSFDLVCIGFGVAGISNAIALRESNAFRNVLFLEPQAKAAWKPCADAAVSRLKTSFLNDLVTSENPRSKFTFLYYLHATNRLVFYANSAHIHPSREMFNDYLRWCASHFESQVKHGKLVTAIIPLKDEKNMVERWRVIFADSETGELQSATTKQVVYAASSQPYVPALLSRPDIAQHILHASECLDVLPSVLNGSTRRMRFAIIGDGQSAAEVFDHLQSIRGDHTATWFTQERALRVPGETPFMTDIIKTPPPTGERALPAEITRRALHQDSDSAIQQNLVHNIYETQYAQSVKEPNSKNWRFQIKFHHTLVVADRSPDGAVRLSFRSLDQEGLGEEWQIFDMVIVATGFRRDGHRGVMASFMDLIDGQQLNVDRDYHINFRSGALKEGCGLWVHGSLAEVNENDDDSYPILASRSRQLVKSLMRNRQEEGKTGAAKDARL